jgi:hypothetical protein
MVEIMGAGLPLPSMIRIAKSYRPGQDLHESIQLEREYVKKLLRESDRGDLGKPESSMLGLTEAANSDFSLTSSDEDFSQMEAILSGKMF